MLFGVDKWCSTRRSTAWEIVLFEESKQVEQCNAVNNVKLWHERLAHNNEKDLKELQKHASGINVTGELGTCEECCTEKAKRQPVNRDFGTRAKKVLDIVHCDVMGPINETTLLGYRYGICLLYTSPSPRDS